MDTFLWVIVPYLCLTTFVVGHFWRYRYDKFGWTTRSSQLYENKLLRIGARVYSMQNQEIAYSLDNGVSLGGFCHWAPGAVRDIATDGAGVLYVASANGLFVSADGCATFTLRNAEDDIHWLHVDGSHLLATREFGTVLRSADGGQTFVTENSLTGAQAFHAVGGGVTYAADADFIYRRTGPALPFQLLAAIGKGELPALDLALSIAEGFGSRNREGWAPTLLEMAGVPLLGSDAAALALSLDKALARTVVAAAGVPIAAGCVMSSAAEAETAAIPAPWPLFVKPRWEGTAKGIGPTSRVEDRADSVATAEVGPGQVHGQRPFPYAVRELGHGPVFVGPDAGVVDEHLHRAEGADHLCDRPLHFAFL